MKGGMAGELFKLSLTDLHRIITGGGGKGGGVSIVRVFHLSNSSLSRIRLRGTGRKKGRNVPRIFSYLCVIKREQGKKGERRPL